MKNYNLIFTCVGKLSGMFVVQHIKNPLSGTLFCDVFTKDVYMKYFRDDNLLFKKILI